METDASILLVDDQPAILTNISLTLKAAGYRVLTTSNGIEALSILESQSVDLILADIAMPGMNGYQLYERVRDNSRWVMIPFLFLTARVMDSDIRYGKELGVDDYLTKPIEVEDLLAAVQGKLRRVKQLTQVKLAQFGQDEASPDSSISSPVAKSHSLIVGQLRIDPDQHQVWLYDKSIRLSAREFNLLEYLAQQVNRVTPATELIQITHGLNVDHVEAGALLRPLIRSLRRKLGYGVGQMGCIENIRSVGYRLVAPGDVTKS